MHARRVRAGIAASLVVVAVLAGCGGPAGSGPVSPTSPSSPSSSGEASPSATIAPEITHAMAQRELFGLRADLAWVLAVAADPRARIFLLDFPMLPEEEAAFEARRADDDAVITAIDVYAATHEDEFGGLYIDQAARTVVAMWTANLETHRLGILEQLGRAGPLQVRQARYTERALRALQERIAADLDWMSTIQVQATGVGVDITTNTVSLGISSANPLAAALILAHYGVPPAMLRVDSDGTGILLQPRGIVHGIVATSDGKAPGPNTLNVTWAPDNPGAGDCGGGDIGYGVGDNGGFDLPCPPGGWTIRIESGVPVGSGHVVVPAGGEVTLRITLDAGAVLFNP